MAIVTKKAAVTWKKITFCYAQEFDDSGASVNLVNGSGSTQFYDRDESTYWQASASVDNASIEVQNTAAYKADYFGIGWHNLGSLGARGVFEYSSDGGSYTTILDKAFANNDAFIYLFDELEYKFFRFRMLFNSGDRPQSL